MHLDFETNVPNLFRLDFFLINVSHLDYLPTNTKIKKKSLKAKKRSLKIKKKSLKAKKRLLKIKKKMSRLTTVNLWKLI
jgi:hypothetical protein